MKIKLSNLSVGSCFTDKKGNEKKKVGDRKIATVRDNGKVIMRKIKGDPEVEYSPCSLRLFGVGQRRFPETLVQIGDGDLLKKRGIK